MDKKALEAKKMEALAQVQLIDVIQTAIDYVAENYDWKFYRFEDTDELDYEHPKTRYNYQTKERENVYNEDGTQAYYHIQKKVYYTDNEMDEQQKALKLAIEKFKKGIEKLV